MKRSNCLILLIVILGLALAGCSRQGESIFADHPGGDLLSKSSIPGEKIVNVYPTVTTMTVLNGFLVQFEGRVYVNDQTTFSYTVIGTGGEHALSFFFLELPDCAPALDSYTPDGVVISVDPHTGIYGIKWNESLGIYDSRSYSITFPGDVPLGVIRATVKASITAAVGEIAGPCDGFEISGAVYVDADENGVRNGADESGIVNVTVTLVDGNGGTQTATTDANGDYMFIKIPGTYTVRIDFETAAYDFNEELAESFDPTGPTSRTVTVGPDSPGNDFGFDPRAQEITYDIEQGYLLTTGEPAKFWIKELRTAMTGSKGKTEFDTATMAQFVAEIQELFLPEPFQFTPGNEFQEALDILSTKSKDPLQQLIRELLAAEFNEVSGKGLVEAPELQSVLLAWAESVVVGASSGPSPAPSPNGRQLLFNGSSIEDAKNLLFRLNGNTGGGSGGGG